MTTQLEQKDTVFRGNKTFGVEFEEMSLTDEGTFHGWGAKYNNVDQGDDLIEPGAFGESIAKRGTKGIKMLYQHRSDKPIGKYTRIEERSGGIYVEGKIEQEVQAGREAFVLAKQGILDGLSIGFRTSDRRYEGDVRIITKGDLREISLVTFPMNEQALIQGVKTEELDPPSIREVERSLMRDAGLSKQQAQSIVAKGYASTFGTERDAGLGDEKELIALLNKAREALRA